MHTNKPTFSFVFIRCPFVAQNEYVGIGSNPEHSTAALFVFAARLGDEPIHVAFTDALCARPALVVFNEFLPAPLFEVALDGVLYHVFGAPVFLVGTFTFPAIAMPHFTLFRKPAPPPSSYLDQVDARGLRGFRQRLIGRRDRQLVTDSQVEVGGGYTDRQAFQKGIRFLCGDAPFPNRQFKLR